MSGDCSALNGKPEKINKQKKKNHALFKVDLKVKTARSRNEFLSVMSKVIPGAKNNIQTRRNKLYSIIILYHVKKHP